MTLLTGFRWGAVRAARGIVQEAGAATIEALSLRAMGTRIYGLRPHGVPPNGLNYLIACTLGTSLPSDRPTVSVPGSQRVTWVPGFAYFLSRETASMGKHSRLSRPSCFSSAARSEDSGSTAHTAITNTLRTPWKRVTSRTGAGSAYSFVSVQERIFDTPILEDLQCYTP